MEKEISVLIQNKTTRHPTTERKNLTKVEPGLGKARTLMTAVKGNLNTACAPQSHTLRVNISNKPVLSKLKIAVQFQ